MAHWTRTDMTLPAVVHGNRAARRSVLAAWGCRLKAILIDYPDRVLRSWALRARLEALDDRMLDDIGMTRRDIRRAKAPRRRSGARACR